MTVVLKIKTILTSSNAEFINYLLKRTHHSCNKIPLRKSPWLPFRYHEGPMDEGSFWYFLQAIMEGRQWGLQQSSKHY